jgi:hypothetical protein
MKWLLRDLTFAFTSNYATWDDISYYQANGILSFAVMDLASKIIKQQERKFITLKKRKPIIHLLNYVDALNFNSNKFGIISFSRNKCKIQLTHSLYLYRSRHFKDLDYKDRLEVIERGNLCIIGFDYDYANKIQPKNVNLAAMVMHIFEKEEIDTIYDADGIIFYCLLLM